MIHFNQPDTIDAFAKPQYFRRNISMGVMRGVFF